MFIYLLYLFPLNTYIKVVLSETVMSMSEVISPVCFSSLCCLLYHCFRHFTACCELKSFSFMKACIYIPYISMHAPSFFLFHTCTHTHTHTHTHSAAGNQSLLECCGVLVVRNLLCEYTYVYTCAEASETLAFT